MLTMPALFATANGSKCVGKHSCFFCGAPCAEQYHAADYVRDSFNDRGLVAQPRSDWVCAGCVLCLREDAEITMADGTMRHVTKAAMRAFSWRVDATGAIACGVGSRETILRWCLEGAMPPWGVSIAVSGQKQLLYRGAINVQAVPPWVVTLEGERIVYTPDELQCVYDLCGRICAASGKPALSEPISTNLAMSVLGRYRDGELYLEEWERVRNQPIGRLGAFLCPGKDGAAERWPADLDL